MKKMLFVMAAVIVLSFAFGTEVFADEYKLDENGVLWGKGKNEYGQLGREPQFELNKYGDKEYIKTEEFVPVLDNVKSYCGVFTLYAIREDNSLWTCGRNDYAQCGVGHTESVYEPVKIMDNVKMVKTTYSGALAVDENGVLYSWGSNEAWMGMAYSKGVLGVGDTKELTLSPVKVLEDVKSVYADSITLATMAVKNNGELWAAGSTDANPNREENSCVFTKVEGIERVKEVSLTTLNVRVDTYGGDVYLFGSLTDWGGTGSFPLRVVKKFKTPVKVMENVEKAVGHADIFGLKPDGTLWYWGEDTNFVDAKCVMNNINDISTRQYFLSANGVLYKYDSLYSENEPVFKVALTDVEKIIDDKTAQKKDKTLWNIGRFDGKIEEIIIPITVYVNGEKIKTDTEPYIKNDRTMVPMRAIFEALGATVTWDDATKTAVGVKDGVEVKITIGENVLYKNGEAIELDCAAEITNDRTMVPVRAISEAFGCKVNWNNETKTVEITN